MSGWLLVALFFVSSLAAPAGTSRTVSVRAADGINLSGTYFDPERKGPAVLLLPQCNMNRRGWQNVAADLAAAGMHVLTIDFRGLGDSGGKPSNDDERRTLSSKWPADVDAALAFLLTQQGVDSTRVAVGGASCGVPQATSLARREHAIRALVVLSGPSMEDARAYIAKTNALAVFGAVASQDQATVQGIKDLVGASSNPASTLKLYDGADHGVELFTAHQELQASLVSWLAAQLSDSKR
jgi:dienelactone hydrolase